MVRKDPVATQGGRSECQPAPHTRLSQAGAAARGRAWVVRGCHAPSPEHRFSDPGVQYEPSR